MGFKEAEERRRKSAVSALISDAPKEKTEESQTRGRPRKDNSYVHKTYYIEREHDIAIGIYAAKNQTDKSAVVRAALDAFLADELKNL